MVNITLCCVADKLIGMNHLVTKGQLLKICKIYVNFARNCVLVT